MVADNVRQTAAHAARLQVARAQRALKRPQEQCSYLRFLLRERARLLDFERKTHVLETTFLPPGVRPARALQRFFVQSVQAWTAELSPKLKALLEHGWLYLSPYQYNLLSLLRRLSDRILAFDFVRLDYRSRYLIDRLKRIERPFLTLACNPEHLPALLEAIRHVCEKTHAAAEDCAQLRGLAERVLAPEVTLPSLHNAILGLNSVRNRRLTGLADLVDLEGPALAGLINTRDFDGGPELRRRIDSYLQESLDSLKKLHAELSEVRRLAGYVRRSEEGEADTAELASFYAGGGEGYEFQADQADTIRLVTRLCRRFEQVFLPLLAGRITLSGGTAWRVFSRNFFAAELDRLRGVAGRLATGPFHFTDFPLERYVRIQGGRLAAIGTEGEAAQLVQEAVAILVDLGKAAARVLSLRAPAAAAGSTARGGGTDQRPAPLEPIVLQGKSFTFSVGERTIAGPPPLAGISVAEALAKVVGICLSVGLLLRDRFLELFFAKQRRVEAELQGRVRLLQNLMSPEDYRDLLASLR